MPMELFAVALFGAVANTALSKLREVIDDRSENPPENDATFITDEFTSIEALIKASYASSTLSMDLLQPVWIGQLRRLAYDIEDCIDNFMAKNISPQEFSIQLGNLKTRSKDTRERIVCHIAIAEGIIRPAPGAGGVAQVEAPAIPTALQDLLNDPREVEWFGRNLECLPYFCLFPNHDVSTNPLMRRWLAEGLVQEDEPDKHLEKLFNANIISSNQTNRDNLDEEKCRPTDDMLECISQWSRSQNFIVLWDGSRRAQLAAIGPRRLSVHLPANVRLNLPQDLSRLRTLAAFPPDGSNPSGYEDDLDFKKYRMLRVLDLKACADLSDDHIWAICDLVLMKYLSINLGSIDSITRKFGYLEQLETLDLGGSKTVMVYKEILLLPKLKHLLGKFQLSISDTLSVPILGLVQSKVEKFLSNKSKLETLDGFVIDRRLGFAQLMKHMKKLRKVKILCKPSATQRNLNAISRAIQGP